MHSKSVFVRLGLIGLFFTFIFANAQAQTVTYDVLLDTDSNTTTGCDVTPAGQGATGGFERRVRAIVDGGSLTVTEVNVAFCEGASFGPATVTGGGHPVGLNNGVNGTDVVELSASLASLSPLTNGVIQVTVVGDDSVGSDLLETTTGMAGGDPILIFIPIAVPALGIFGLLLLIAAIAVFTVRGRQRRWLSISLLAASGIVFAASFIVDGQVTDWGGVNPDATDPANDSTNGAAGNDIQAFFSALENDTLFFRIDVADLENQPPIAVDDAFNVLEDNALNVAAPGVLGNDTDPDGDPITAMLVTGPSDAQAFTLNADGSFDYTPNADFNGIDTFIYTANDGFVDSDQATVTITIDPVNDVPSFTVPADTTLLEDAGAQNIAGFATAISAGPADESGQTLTFNITNNDNAALFDVAPTLDPVTGNLTFTAADDANGTANITVELMDDGGTANGGVDTSAPQTFAIIVTTVNDAPTITIAADADVLEDAGAQSLAGFATDIMAGPPDEVGQTLTLTITDNDNAGLFSLAPDLAIDGTLTFTAADDANGTANITIELTDDGGTADGGVDTSGPITFAINVTAVNDEPEFTLAGNPATVLEDAGAQAVPGFATGISAGPADENAQILTFNITNNSNPALFSAAPAIDPVSGELTYTPADDANGTADITVELMDDGGTDDGGDDTSAPQMFTITVTAVNDTPVFTAGTPPDVPEDAGAQSIAGIATSISAGPADENAQVLTFNITNNTNAALFSAAPALAADGTLTYTPTANVSGTADITVELMDDGGTANGGDDTSDTQTFTITVLSVNDVPSFVVGPNQSVSINDGAQTINPWATAISAGPADELGQTLTFNILSNSAPNLFTVLPAVAANGTLTYTPDPGLATSGTATIMLNVSDNGGTANGGVDTSAAQQFTIEVLAVLPPTATDDSFDAAGNISITVPLAAGLIINDDDGGGTNTVTAFDASSSQGGDVAVAADGSFSYDPPPGFTGDDTFTYMVTNSAGSDTGTVTVTVTGLIWFVDASAAAGGDGRLSGPFDDLAVGADSFDVNAADDPGDNIFVAQGNYQGGLTLLDNQRLIGEGATASLAAITGITVPPNSAALPATGGTRPAVTSATNGINLGSGNTLRGFNIGDAVTGVSGANFGTLTASEMLINGTGEAIDLDTGNANSVTFDSIGSTNSTSEGILLDSVSGSFTVTGLTNVDNAANIGVNIQNSSATYTFGDVTVNNRNSAGVFINANTGGIQNGQFGTVTINNQNISGTTAFGIDNTVTGGSTITVTSVAINNNGSNSSAIALSNNDGATININGGSVQNAAGAAVSVSNSTGSATYTGTISNTAGRSVQVLTNGGASATTFTGNITDSGTGIFLNNNTGHTINFIGVLDLDTTSNTAFTATGGGTVNANNAGSTINNTTGTGVNIANTTIGGAGVTFRSVSMSGGSSGIILNNTGNGSFTVTGDGSNAQNGSGGVIQNTTSHAVSLNNTANVTLRSMNISNPGDAAGENGINATELGGSNLIRGGVFTGQGTASSDYIRIANSTSNLTLLEVNNSDFTGVNSGGNDAILFNMSGNVTARLDVLNSNDFDGLLGDGVQVIADGLSDVTANINGNRFSNDSNIQPGGIGGNSASRLSMGTSDALLVNGGTLTANVIGNTMFDSGVQNGALPVGLVGVFDFVNNQAGAGIINANNNTISNIEEDGGKRFIGDDNTLLFTILVDGNTIDDVNEPGVFFHPRDNTVAADLTIRNNMIGDTTPVGTENANFNEDTIRLFSDDNAGSGSSIDILVEDNILVTSSSSQSIDGDFEDGSNTNLTIHGNDMTNNNTDGEAFDLEADNGGDVCLDMNADNIGADSNTTNDGATSANSELHLQEDPGTVFLIEDLVGGVAAFLNGRNSLENLDIVADAPNSFAAAGGECGMPTLPPPP